MTLLGGQTAGRSSLGNCHNFLGPGKTLDSRAVLSLVAMTMSLPSGLNAALLTVRSKKPHTVLAVLPVTPHCSSWNMEERSTNNASCCGSSMQP